MNHRLILSTEGLQNLTRDLFSTFQIHHPTLVLMQIQPKENEGMRIMIILKKGLALENRGHQIGPVELQGVKEGLVQGARTIEDLGRKKSVTEETDSENRKKQVSFLYF